KKMWLICADLFAFGNADVVDCNPFRRHLPIGGEIFSENERGRSGYNGCSKIRGTDTGNVFHKISTAVLTSPSDGETPFLCSVVRSVCLVVYMWCQSPYHVW